VPRVPVLAGTRVVSVPVADDLVLRPPEPLDAIADVAAAVREAVRYPLSGRPLAELVPASGRVALVVEHPSLPVPGALLDPRQEALAAVIDELERYGVPSSRQTIVVAGGLEQRARGRELDALLRPGEARAFHGEVVVHDCADPDLAHVGDAGDVPFRVSPAVASAALVVVVSAAQTVLHGGPAALLGAAGPEPARGATAESLLATSTAPGWRLALALERALAARTPLFGVSLVLDHPRLTGSLRGYPSDPSTDEKVRVRARITLGWLPRLPRRRVLQDMQRELRAMAAFAGPPSVAHAEALLRGVAVRGAQLAAPVDALVVPLPWKAPHRPREPLNPLTAAATGLGLALRLWRDAHPVVEGGTAILLHGFGRSFGHGSQEPYRLLFQALRDARDPGVLVAAEQAAARDERAIDAYRAGRACHPLLAFADWAACAPALERLGRVIVAGCRDAGAARALGFVPSHSVGTALEMAAGVTAAEARIALLAAPPYAPLLVGGAD
jgi:hypothetical protein